SAPGRTGQAPVPAAHVERPPGTPMLEQPPAMPAFEGRPVPADPGPGPRIRERATSSGVPAEPVTTRVTPPVPVPEPPATTNQEEPSETAEAPGSGKRALASGVRRPGAPEEFWKAIAPPEGGAVPDPASQNPASQDPASQSPASQDPASLDREQPEPVEPVEPVVGQSPDPTRRAEPQSAVPQVAGPAAVMPDADESSEERPVPKVPTTRPDIPQVPAATRPDIPMVPGAFGAGGRGAAPARPGTSQPEEHPVAEQSPDGQSPGEQPVGPSPVSEQQTSVSEPHRPAAEESAAQRTPVQEPVAQQTPVQEPAAPGTDSEVHPEPQPAAGEGPSQPAEDGPPPWSKSLGRPMQEGQTDALVWPPPGHKRRIRAPKHRRATPEAPAAQSPQAVPPETPAAAADTTPGAPPAQVPPAQVPPAQGTPAEVTPVEAKPPAVSPQASPPAVPPAVPPRPVGRPLPPVQPAAASEQGPAGTKAPPAKDRRTWPAQPPVRGIPPRPQGTPLKPPAPNIVPEEARQDLRPQQAPLPRAVPPSEPQPVSWEPETRSGPASPVRPRPRPLVPPTPPPPPAATITPPDLEQEGTVGGLRRLIQAVGGGHNELDAEYEERLQRPFQGTRHIVVLGCTGGAGQTVTALMLGHTFAQHCGEPIVAIDVNPGPGALARRTRSETPETLTGLISRADQVHSLTAMRRYTSQAKSGLDVIAAGKNPLQALDDRDYALAIRTLDRFYSVTMLDAAAAVVARVLPHADQIVLVAPASADAPRAVGMTFEWLDGHGYDGLRSRAVTVINGVSRRSMDDVEQAEAVARGQCRALVRIPWDDHLSLDRSPRNELKALRAPTRRAYLALAGVVAGGFATLPERYQEHEQEVGR
ncbi:MAG: hypothetical protein QOE54_6365, partial [Streptosporangiaceae bacterium]|nr:hypothetical protein [Streptosporangiaceae bacterium]